MVDFEEIFQSPGFWLLGGGAVAATLLGNTISIKTAGFGFPIWQLIIVILGELVAAAFFATRE